MVFRKHLRYIFIPVLAILLMSHNANAAVQLTQDVVLVRGNYQSEFMGSTWVNPECITGTNYWIQNNCSDVNMFASFLRMSIPNIDYPMGYFITIDLYLYNNNSSDSLDGWLSGMRVDTESQPWVDLVDVSYESISSSSGVAHLTFRSFNGGTRSTIAVSWPGGNFLKLYNQERIALGTTTVWNTRITSYTHAIQDAINAINNLNSSINSMSSKLNELGNLSTNQQQTNQKLDRLYQQQQQQQQKEENAINDSIDGSQDAGDTASNDSETATQSLLDTITGFFNAIMHLDASNCKFNSGLPFLSGQGEIDLCSVQTPPIIQVLSSLVLVGLFIPFAIHMFNRFISITESFQR